MCDVCVMCVCLYKGKFEDECENEVRVRVMCSCFASLPFPLHLLRDFGKQEKRGSSLFSCSCSLCSMYSSVILAA